MWVRVAQLVVLLLTLLVTDRARAWVSSHIASDAVIIDVDREGEAVVAHELKLRVRGGPLKGFAIKGVDLDAKVLPDAMLLRARSGRSGSVPIPLLTQSDEAGTLNLELDHPKGVYRGTYLVRFRYRTKLLERGMVQVRGRRARLRWVGPRFDDGIDSAMVTFRVAHGTQPPRLPADAVKRDDLGTFLSTLRRTGQHDELQLVRPHVAKGEPVVWQIEADAASVAGASEPVPARQQVTERAPRSGPDRGLLAGLLAAVALLFGAMLWWKGRASAQAAAERGARAAWLLPLPLPLRAALFGCCLAGAVALTWLADEVTGAAVAFVAALLLASQRPADAVDPPRGPGCWVELPDAVAFHGPRRRLPGRLLDAGHPLGFACFALGLAGFVTGAVGLFPVSAIHALLLGLASSVLAPIFLTGRERGLPVQLAEAPRAHLEWLAGRLRRRGSLHVAAYGRKPAGQDHIDELRLLVRPATPLAGLVAIEAAVEYQRGTGGPLELPCVLLRVRNGSVAHEALPPGLGWSRGRSAEEQVAILRPRLPTRAMTLELLEQVLRYVSQPASKGRNHLRPSKAASSAGKGDVTSKAGASSRAA